MTVLVGVLCADGIVVGADSAATFVAGKTRTVEQPTRKIEIVQDHVVVATTGPVGMGQRFATLIEDQFKEKLFSGTRPVDVGRKICQSAIEDFKSTDAPKGEFGALVAYANGDRPQLIEFAIADMQPELKNENLWYVSMGSGQPIADPFLGLMRRAFCPDAPPRLSTGLFMTAWTLQHTIDVNPGGIKEPLRLAAVQRNAKGKYQAEYLGEDRLSEHVKCVDAAYEYLAGAPESLFKKQAPKIPE